MILAFCPPPHPNASQPTRPGPDRAIGAIRQGFLDGEWRQDLLELMQIETAGASVKQCAHALLLLDIGVSCKAVAQALNLDVGTIWTWHQLYLGSRGGSGEKLMVA